MRKSRCAAAIAGCFLCLAARDARQDPAAPPPQFRSGVELVQVDVSVLDRERRPVRGLTATDFTVLEDGVRQDLVSFAEIAVPEAPEVQTAWMRDVAPDVKTNVAGADRLIMLVLDDAQLPANPRKTAAVREIGRRVIDRLGPSDLAGVVFTKDNSGAQPFTSDRARLLKAVDSFVAGFQRTAGGRDLAVEYFQRSSLETLKMVAENLAGARERRKAIVYVSPGVPIGADGFRLLDLRQILQNAQRGNVNVYCIDPSGLETLGDENAEASGLTGDVGSFALSNPVQEFLRELASNTGGLAIVNRNEFAEGVTQMFRENGTYYLIGYQSSNAASDGTFRKISVRVNRPGVIVRARSGYETEREKKGAKPQTVSAGLSKALSAVVPDGGVAMQITAAPFVVPGKKEAALAIVLALGQPAPSAKGRMLENDVFVGAYGPDGGRPLASQRLKADAVVRPVEGAPVQYELLAQLDVKPGRYQLRVAAHSATEGKNGSIYFDVEIPDFSKAPVSLSGIVVTATPSVFAAPKDRFAALLPVVPTARREFRRGDRASAFLRIYQRSQGTPAAIAIAARILNGAGATSFQATETVEADQFGTIRSADYAVQLPLEKLASGPYLLTVEASLGKNTARRDVRFVVH